MAFEALAAVAREELAFKTKAHANMWGFGNDQEWGFDQDEGVIWWKFDSGQEVRAPAEIVGSFDPVSNSWLWAWANSSLDQDTTKIAKNTYNYGKQNSLEALTTSKISGDLDESWTFAAIAMHLSAQQGVYRAATDGPYVFIAFGHVKIAK